MPLKLSLFGIPELKPGKHNVKDPRLDRVHELVEADKKTYAQVDVVGEESSADADVLIVTPDTRADLILQDLEFIETRLGRNPPEAEKTVLVKMQKLLESEQFLFNSGLSADELAAVAAHSFATNKPVIVTEADERTNPDKLILRAFQGSGYISFLTVGGKENRAWPIRKGTTAWEAAGSIHTDLQKGFIRAEIVSYDDFIEAGGETQAKRANKLRLETKSYVMQDYDLVNFRFSK